MSAKPPSHALTLALHPDGWKLHILAGGHAQEPLRLTVAATEQIARVMGDAVISEGPAIAPYELVRQATAGLAQQIDNEIAEAEATAKTIPALRKARQEVGNIQ